MSEDALRDAADRLYGAPSADFVRKRTALAKGARDDGDRDLAARIGALAKPSAAAALVNELARAGQEDLQRALKLGADLREAQEHADRAALQRLTAERRTLLPEIAERAADRAAAHGKRPGPAALEELQQTLQAALGSEAAAAAVRSGRLLRGLSADGLEDVDLERAVAVPGRAAERPRRRTRGEDPGEQEDQQAAERERAEQAAEEARRQAEDLRERAAAADRTARSAEDDADARRRDAEGRRAEAEAAQQRLAEAEDAADAARQAAERARHDAHSADQEAGRAEQAADEARAALR